MNTNCKTSKQQMSVEQRQQKLARRRSNYKQNNDKGKQVRTSHPSDMSTMISFQDLTNVNLASRFYRRPHDSEVEPSTTYANRVPSADTSTEGRYFRQHIRSYNHVMSVTSPGVHVDESLVATGRGIYTFRDQGAIYHKIGGFHPNQGSRPRYLQLYIYDTDHELQNRMMENPILNQAVVYKQKIPHQRNTFVIVFRQLGLKPNVEDYRLLIKERPSNQPQYNLPSASQVATIVIGGGDEYTIKRARDINVINCDRKLTKVQETMGYYDPLQYHILLSFGAYGWDIETKTNVRKNVTCREYHSYVLQIRRNDQSILLKSGQLLQQYVVDNYVKIETGRLRWIRRNQNNIRYEVYQGLQDALHDGRE
ncbi:hypothetical protein KIW84_013099 [Lathyrus oleraceus]|uniref:Helitron helicase-like domain-containing protein n=1 Tax=Pisum sativum TaxID=3888 RepID=A0A9D5GX83_PEA|nr:hypothetical protein KIW84_013099 [Pisum sativum]